MEIGPIQSTLSLGRSLSSLARPLSSRSLLAPHRRSLGASAALVLGAPSLKGEAKTNRVVIVALYPIVKESFQIYYDIAENNGTLVDRFMAQEVHGCVKIYEMFCRVCKQFDELDLFYGWRKGIGYSQIEKITSK